MSEVENIEVICLQRARSLLKDMMTRGSNLEPLLLFSSMWKELSADRDLLKALSAVKIGVCHFLQLNLKERLHFLIVVALQEANIFYCSINVIEGAQHIKSALSSSNSSMFVGVHDGFAFMSRVLLHYDRKVSIITSDPYIGNTLLRTGVRPDQVELITNDFKCLGRLRESMLRGIIPANCVDYSGEDGVFRLISPKLFEYAIKRKASVIFSKRQIADDGVMNIYIRTFKSTLDPIADAQAFIEFQKSDNYCPDRIFVVAK